MPRASTDLARLTQGGAGPRKPRALTVGRHSKLTPEVSKKICDAVRAGNHISVAARYAGVSPATLWSWKAKAEAATTRTGRDKMYVEFLEDLDAAEAFAEVSANLHWRSAMPKDWHAAERWLQTRYPERYSNAREGGGAQQAVQVNVGSMGPAPVESGQLSTQSISRLLEANPELIASTMGVLDALLPTSTPTNQLVEGDWREVPAVEQNAQHQLSFEEDSDE